MDEDGPTDVLSFPLDEEADEGGSRMLGDVVIAPAVRDARGTRRGSASSGCCSCTASCTCSGYDHEEEAERAEMWARQEPYSGVRRVIWAWIAVVVLVLLGSGAGAGRGGAHADDARARDGPRGGGPPERGHAGKRIESTTRPAT